MPDFPRPDLTGITVTVTCDATPGCTPDTPCADCREILSGEVDHTRCTPGMHDYDWHQEDYPSSDDQRHDGNVRLCNDCGAILLYCKRDENYHHGGLNTPACFLVQEDGTDRCVLSRAASDRGWGSEPASWVCLTHYTGLLLSEGTPCPHDLTGRARVLGEEHRAAGVAPFGEPSYVYWDAGSADLMTALGETADLTDENEGRRRAALEAYCAALGGDAE